MARTAAVSNVRPLVAYAIARGVPDVCARFGLDPDVLADVDGRIPLATLARLWNELPALCNDPEMPLHVLEHAAALEPPLAMLVFLASPTLGEALRRLVRYERLNFDLADEPATAITVDEHAAHVVLHHERSAVAPPTGAVIDSHLGVLLLARFATGTDVVPLRIELRHPPPADPTPYLQAFRCPLVFGAPRDRMSLPRAAMDLPHPDASRTLLSIVQRHAESALADLPREPTFLGDLRRRIRAGLPEGGPQLSTLAEQLALSPRTLQRRIEHEGTSWRRLIDDERRQLALEHVRNTRTSLVDVAFLLGFADQSAFTRAFTRWTGSSPRAYRMACPAKSSDVSAQEEPRPPR